MGVVRIHGLEARAITGRMPVPREARATEHGQGCAWRERGVLAGGIGGTGGGGGSEFQISGMTLRRYGGYNCVPRAFSCL